MWRVALGLTSLLLGAPLHVGGTVAVQEIPLWPEGVPDAIPNAPPEHVEDGRVYDVNVPTLTMFQPTSGAPARTAVIVAPGGGYVRLAASKEGSEMTRWLAGLGVTAFVLKYRVTPYTYPSALRDVLRAVRFVRAHADELGVDPHRVGVMGSSAGGHLAASAATLFDAPEGKTGAALDAVSARPDFAVVLYPVITMRDPYAHAGSRRALLGARPTAAAIARASIEEQIGKDTPPVFIVHTAEDQSVPVENSVLLYQALRRAGAPVELHLYETGPHGFGLRAGLGPTSAWPHRCEEWMRFHGWLLPAPAAAAVPARAR